MSATPLTDAEYILYMAGRALAEVGHTKEGAEHAARLRAIASCISEETNRAQDAVMRGLVMAEALKFYAEHAGEYANVAIDALAEATK